MAISAQQIIQNLTGAGFAPTSSQIGAAQAAGFAVQGVASTGATTTTGATPLQTPAQRALAENAARELGITLPPVTTDEPTLPKVADSELDAQLQALLNNPNLSQDQKDLVQNIFDLTTTNDKANMVRFISAINAATEFSAPFFKAQVLVATDALSRSISGLEGDLEFQEGRLGRSLELLRQNTEASKGLLSFEHQQELRNLETNFEQDLETTRQSLATVGKTSSSVRSRAERLLTEQKEGLVSSSRRRFAFETGRLERGLGAERVDTAAQIAFLTDKATQDRITKLREAESQVGTAKLEGLGFAGLLGGQPGSIPRQQQLEALDVGRKAITTPSFVF